MKYQRGLGIIFVLVGILIILSSASGITGNVISTSEFSIKTISSILGLAFVIGGLGIMMAGGLDISSLSEPSEYASSSKSAFQLKNYLRFLESNGEALQKMVLVG
jgi:hypothetical protein